MSKKNKLVDFFFLALMEGNIFHIKKILKGGFCIIDDYEINGEIINPVMTIIREDKVEIMEFLIGQEYIDSGLLLRGEISILSYSILNGSKEMTSRLLKSGADYRKCDATNSPPMVYAIASGNDEALEMLLDIDPDFNINFTVEGKYLPIFIAAMSGNKKAMISLLNLGSSKIHKGIHFLDLIRDRDLKDEMKFFMEDWKEEKYGVKEKRSPKEFPMRSPMDFPKGNWEEESSEDDYIPPPPKERFIFKTFTEFLMEQQEKKFSSSEESESNDEYQSGKNYEEYESGDEEYF